MSVIPVALVLCLAISAQRSFVDTAPLNEGNGPEATSAQDSSVRELEGLKHSIGKTVAMMKTHSSVYLEENGQKEAHADTRDQVSADGRVLARVAQHVDVGPQEAQLRTSVDIPDKGVHQSFVQPLAPQQTENGNRRSVEALLPEPGNSVENKYNTFGGIQYSPLDMAEYVFWTGDEKGVTLAIEEFLQEGLMSREEAISFLQEIKYNLDYLKNHYTQLGLNSREHSRPAATPKQLKNILAAAPEKPELRSSFDLSQLRQEVTKKGDPELHSAPSKTTSVPKSQDEDYDELLERLRVADFLYTEYSLEEVIYQLAKVMFTQSLTRGSAEAQQALQKFTNFLEMEAEQGHISRALEKKVLDVLIASLSDTLSEHPELLSTARESLDAPPNADGQHFLRQILEISPGDKAYKGQKDIKIANRVPLGLGKYKNP